MTRFMPALLLLLYLLSSCGFAPDANSPTPPPVIVTVVVTATPLPAPPTPSLAAADLQATATAQPARATAQAIADHTTVSFGPKNRTIPLTMRGFFGYGTNKEFTDFVTESRWYNPYAASGEDSWSYGYVFRFTQDKGYYRLSIDADANWNLTFALGEHDTILSQGTVSAFNRKADEYNDVRLIVVGATALFFVNDRYIATISDLDQVKFGDIAPSASGRDGTAARYENFTVQSVTTTP